MLQIQNRYNKITSTEFWSVPVKTCSPKCFSLCSQSQLDGLYPFSLQYLQTANVQMSTNYRDCLTSLRWAKNGMVQQGLSCRWAAWCLKNFIKPVHVLIYKNVVPAYLQNTSSLPMCQPLISEKFAFGQLPAGCKFHLVGRKPHANWVFCIAWPLARCNLHSAGGRLNEICIQMAAN